MIAILSPAKNMKKGQPPLSVPCFSDCARQLSDICRQMQPSALEHCFRISPELALKTYMLWQDHDDTTPAGSAATVYSGIAYTYLNADDFTKEDMAFADDHLYILSALYGALRPGDGISPYRLEMMCRSFPGGNLYKYWGERVYHHVVKPGRTLVNLASAEYSRMITDYAGAQDDIIEIEFLTRKKGKLTQQATYAKMARGSMVRYMIKNRLTDPEDLKAFCEFDFNFSEGLSDKSKYVFVREVQ